MHTGWSMGTLLATISVGKLSIMFNVGYTVPFEIKSALATMQRNAVNIGSCAAT